MAKRTSKQVQGAMNKRSGANFESLISASCVVYKLNGLALIEKTPEPMKVLRRQGGGLFTCCFEKKAQADYKGILKDGKAIIFEAKNTTKDRLRCSVISVEQRDNLNRAQELGAECFVFISFNFERFFFVPWHVFKNAKALLGRQYFLPEELTEFEVNFKNGFLDFLAYIN